MINDDNEADVCISPGVRLEISSPVSIALHPSGEMDVIFFDSLADGDQHVKQRIRFGPRAAAQFLDAINAAAEGGHIVFGNDTGVFLH
ncbi:MAG TPA: hypothetical protein VG105_16545 [Paraburkholderia sp.]|nr:hypothetical protein [Paraburkholderia sp.]